MKLVLAAAFGLLLTMTSADAQSCKGRVESRTGPGGTLTLCLDGKYSTCLRDSQRLGWSAAAAKASCDRKRAQGLVS